MISVELEEDRLTLRMPDARRVRLLIPSVCEGKTAQTESFSYAGLEGLIQQMLAEADSAATG